MGKKNSNGNRRGNRGGNRPPQRAPSTPVSSGKHYPHTGHLTNPIPAPAPANPAAGAGKRAVKSWTRHLNLRNGAYVAGGAAVLGLGAYALGRD